MAGWAKYCPSLVAMRVEVVLVVVFLKVEGRDNRFQISG
jgi:hypothetical protein